MKAAMMKAALLYGKEDLRVQEVPRPQIGDGEVLVKVRAAAVCGTDIRMYRNGHRGVSEATPLVLGHEIAGVVEQVGPGAAAAPAGTAGAAGWREGARVAVAPNYGCGVCDACVSGNTQLCPDYQAFGISLDGGFAEYLRVPEPAVRQGNLTPIPEGVSFEEAALAEPFSCVYNAFQRCNIRPGDRVLVIGAGPIGLMHARLAWMGGAAEVLISDINRERAEACRRLMPQLVVVESAALKESVRERTGGRGLEVVITACPSADAQRDALELAGTNGRVMFFGGLPAGRSTVPLDTNLVHYKQLIITGTARSSLLQYRRTVALLQDPRARVADLVTAAFPVEQTLQAFRQVMEGKGLKNAIVFD